MIWYLALRYCYTIILQSVAKYFVVGPVVRNLGLSSPCLLTSASLAAASTLGPIFAICKHKTYLLYQQLRNYLGSNLSKGSPGVEDSLLPRRIFIYTFNASALVSV